MRRIYCPNCGTENKVGFTEPTTKYVPLSVEFQCKNCDITISVYDSSSFDQEGTIALEFH